MALVVVKGASIMWSHGGALTPVAGEDTATVSGMGIVTLGMETPLTFGKPEVPIGALRPCTAATPAGTHQPCVTSPSTAGMSTTLFIGGKPALLATATGQTASGAGLGKWTVSQAGQTQLQAT